MIPGFSRLGYSGRVIEPLVECVPNFSEGCRVEVLSLIETAIRSLNGVLVLGQERDADHNRSVFTFVGGPDAVLEAAVRAAVVAAKRIDLNGHAGVHPRIGAADVIPFIPLAGVTMEACATLARRAAGEIWRRAQVPSYLYEFAARRAERSNLEAVRKVGFEALRARALTDLPPDVGGPALHPTAGACAVGARRILIACNVNLVTDDLGVAKRVAREIRASSGGIPYVKALGLGLPSRGLVQVSMNLTHYEVTGLGPVFERIAAAAGVPVHSTEIIGFPPRAALVGAERFLAVCEGWSEGRVLENRIAAVRGDVTKEAG